MGSDAKSSGQKMDELADHGLVFMFTSLYESYSQPIAVFASRNVTKGSILANLCLKAIILLEEATAVVVGVLSDGASTNRCMWRELGVSGRLGLLENSFIHPLDDDRRVYMFSDAPHLIKCIRNRLKNQKCLQVKGEWIKWCYYDQLYVADRSLPAHLRICPKLTFSHLNPSSTEKMRVKLATQVFSNSVADGLQFHQQKGTAGFGAQIKATILFTRRMNMMFDALNRKFPREGLCLGNRDFQV